MIVAKNSFKLSFVFLVCLIFSACTSESEKLARSRMPVNQMPKTSKPMPPVDLDVNKLGWQLIDGRRETLADYRGKAVILDFWATYCPPCIEGIPHFNDLKRRYEAQGLRVVGLHVGGDEDKPKIPEFVEKLQISYQLAYPDREFTNFYLQGDDRIPQTLVFDRNGQLVEQFVGFTPEIKEGIDRAVGQALN
jgi:cytochrome c biogenesis protein CcmG/thiol:disulfide interchange protein DsbE